MVRVAIMCVRSGERDDRFPFRCGDVCVCVVSFRVFSTPSVLCLLSVYGCVCVYVWKVSGENAGGTGDKVSWYFYGWWCIGYVQWELD